VSGFLMFFTQSLFYAMRSKGETLRTTSSRAISDNTLANYNNTVNDVSLTDLTAKLGITGYNPNRIKVPKTPAEVVVKWNDGTGSSDLCDVTLVKIEVEGDTAEPGGTGDTAVSKAAALARTSTYYIYVP